MSYSHYNIYKLYLQILTIYRLNSQSQGQFITSEMKEGWSYRNNIFSKRNNVVTVSVIIETENGFGSGQIYTVGKMNNMCIPKIDVFAAVPASVSVNGALSKECGCYIGVGGNVIVYIGESIKSIHIVCTYLTSQ